MATQLRRRRRHESDEWRQRDLLDTEDLDSMIDGGALDDGEEEDGDNDADDDDDVFAASGAAAAGDERGPFPAAGDGGTPAPQGVAGLELLGDNLRASANPDALALLGVGQADAVALVDVALNPPREPNNAAQCWARLHALQLLQYLEVNDDDGDLGLLADLLDKGEAELWQATIQMLAAQGERALPVARAMLHDAEFHIETRHRAACALREMGLLSERQADAEAAQAGRDDDTLPRQRPPTRLWQDCCDALREAMDHSNHRTLNGLLLGELLLLHGGGDEDEIEEIVEEDMVDGDEDGGMEQDGEGEEKDGDGMKKPPHRVQRVRRSLVYMPPTRIPSPTVRQTVRACFEREACDPRICGGYIDFLEKCSVPVDPSDKIARMVSANVVVLEESDDEDDESHDDARAAQLAARQTEAEAAHQERLAELTQHWALLQQHRRANMISGLIGKMLIIVLALLAFQVFNALYGPLAHYNRAAHQSAAGGQQPQ